MRGREQKRSMKIQKKKSLDHTNMNVISTSAKDEILVAGKTRGDLKVLQAAEKCNS